MDRMPGRRQRGRPPPPLLVRLHWPWRRLLVHSVATMDGEPITLASVPVARPRARLSVSWGPGNELHCVDLHSAVNAGPAPESTASVVQW